MDTTCSKTDRPFAGLENSRSHKMEGAVSRPEIKAILSGSGFELPSIRPSPLSSKMISLPEDLESVHLTAESPSDSSFPEEGRSFLGSGTRTPRKLRVQFITWNLNRVGCTVEDLQRHLLRVDSEPADLYVIGTQEVGSTVQWHERLQEAFGLRRGPGAGFRLVATKSLWDIHISLYRQSGISVDSVAVSSVATGIGNMLGNKGAVAVAARVANGLRCLFINAHFTAHDGKLEERNADYRRISSELLRGLADNAAEAYDVTFWGGDLNYRLKGNRRALDAVIRENMYEVMRANDQLTQQRLRGAVFEGFEEGELAFPPTYKFDNGSDHYDTSSKARIPSWTDRVLWKSKLPGTVELLHYSSVPELKTSDHRAVVATFDVMVPSGKGRGGDALSPSAERTLVKSATCAVQ
uniref:Phosphatidylinositol-bisphosphatase n=1 Tax=Tetraselmis sp. GSL018 TaxID=582737 RepID=A0A061S2I7_9CHLO|mmetsp:Transcript_8517/g.20442  ORF Transcript_8517/g.20442 Transcript_8517/m.20442 type:complete len:409 (+) Transcript_8517:340-1566(+)